MALKLLQFVALVATFVAFVSHMPVNAGDSCQLNGGVLNCPGECDDTFGKTAPVQITPYKIEVGSTLCRPNWDDLRRLFPGVMVLDCSWKGVACPIGSQPDGCPCLLDAPPVFDDISTQGPATPRFRTTARPTTTPEPPSESTEPVMETTTSPELVLNRASTLASTARTFLWAPTTKGVVFPGTATSTELPQDPTLEPTPKIQQSKIDWMWIKLDDVDEITILLATVSSLLTLGLFKFVCWVVRRIISKIKGAVDKSLSSSLDKRWFHRENELIRKMEEGGSGPPPSRGRGRVVRGVGPIDWENGVANENVDENWGSTAVTRHVSPVSSTPYNAGTETISGEVPSPWYPGHEEQPDGWPTVPKRKMVVGRGCAPEKTLSMKQPDLKTFRSLKAASAGSGNVIQAIVEYRNAKPEPGMEDIEEGSGSDSSLPGGVEVPDLNVMKKANTSFTVGDTQIDAEMSAKLATIALNDDEK